MLLANRLVYGDKLKCGSFKVASNHLKLNWQRQNTIGQKLLWPIQVLTNNHGVMFLDTDSMGEPTAESSSSVQTSSNGRRIMENIVEAQVVAGLVELLVLGSMPPDEIAVISPFRSQVALIQQHLTAVAAFRRAGGSEWVHSVEVSTIDKYQGKDKGVILVSFVRCNEEKRVGELLTDWRRINVALTRAKQKLLLVGSQSTLGGGSALFHVLSDVVQEQQWGYKLPRDAAEALRQLAVSVAAPIEPDPEQAAMAGRRSSDNVKVSVLQRSAASNGDIESLVPNVSSIPLRPRQGIEDNEDQHPSVGFDFKFIPFMLTSEISPSREDVGARIFAAAFDWSCRGGRLDLGRLVSSHCHPRYPRCTGAGLVENECLCEFDPVGAKSSGGRDEL
ncbi:hypothetical protein ON010_g7719 [Phytophthora cinnamomi]|nr:hypothetical protein ON010_g7719 [Phytophthora cinnamomi]